MALKKVFFSYSRIDGAQFASRLALDLQKEQFDVWIDQQDIRAGSEWDIEIEKALETCDYLLFIETARSVISENVLDEVYYALAQRKKVIPLIVVDSKTPYRLQRLQHIDFTTNYQKGLAQLVKELSGPIVFDEQAYRPIVKPQLPFIKKYRRPILLTSMTVVAIAIVLVFMNKKNSLPSVQNEISNSHTQDTIISTQPTPNNLQEERASEDVRTAAPNNILTPGRINSNKKTADKPVVNNPKEATTALSAPASTYAGDWILAGMDPGAKSFDGYLKITTAADDKFNIRTHIRFFYRQTNDTSYLTIFNSFAGCASCDLQQHMNINTEDIALGSNYFKILKKDMPPDGKAGDTVMSAGGNKSIRGSFVLRFINNKTATITVQRTTPVELSYGLIVQPFLYTFKFNKLED